MSEAIYRVVSETSIKNTKSLEWRPLMMSSNVI